MMAMQFNPIFVRESRARWRGWRGFALVLGYAVLLSAMMAFFYSDSVGDVWGQADNGQRSAKLGAEMFMHLTWMQALGWMLMAPALTASSIAGERENGLLEALYLAPLAPARIVSGKLWSVGLFVFLMLVVALPPVAICFLLGGVSPLEFWAAALLHAATAWFCAAFGLFCSAWSRRAGTAMRAAFLCVVVWGICSAISLGIGSTLSPTIYWRGWVFLLQLFGMTNPIYAALAITNNDPFTSGLSTSATIFSHDLPSWSVCIFVQIIFGVLLLILSARALRRPLTEPYWAGENNAAPSTASPGNEAVAPVQKPRRTWRELPIIEWIHFSNPILQRELRGKFRMRQPSPWTLGCAFPLTAIIAYGYVRLLWGVWTQPYLREGVWESFLFIGLTVLILMCGIMGASAFTREREAGTWESLGLSLLSARTIILGKLLPPIIAAILYSMLAWPILLPAILLPGRRVGIGAAIASILVLLATAWNLTAFGMLVSWQCRRTAAATGWVIGALLFGYLLAPIFTGILGEFNEDWLRWWHPFLALDATRSNGDKGVLQAIIGAASLFGIGCFWLLLLRGTMRDGVREREGGI